MKAKIHSDILIFFVALFLIALGPVFGPNISFNGLILLLILLPYFMLKFSEVFSKTSSLAGIFVFGLVINVLLVEILLQTKDMKIGMTLLSLLPFTLILIPDVFATSLLIRMGVKREKVFAFYFLFLVSVFVSGGLVLFALLPTGNATPSNSFLCGISREFPVFPILILYLELTAIPSAFCLIYRYTRSFLVFIPMPVALIFAMYFSLG